METKNLCPTEPNDPFFDEKSPKKFPVLLSGRAGSFYTRSCIAVQLIASVVYYLFRLTYLFLPTETADVLVTYAGFSTQFVIAGCVIVFLLKFKVTPAEAGLRKTKFFPCLIGVLFGAGVIFAATPAEAVFDNFLKLFGYEVSNVIEDVPMDGGLLYPALFMVAVMPAFGEEFVFRGIILESTKKFGTWQACLLNGLLFSLFHCNPSQTCYTFLMGAAFALIAVRCNSIVPTIIVHFLNNAYSILMMYFNVTEFSDRTAYAIVISALICTVIGLIYFLDINKSGNEQKSLHTAPFWKGAAGGLIFNGALWLFVFVSTIVGAGA